MPKVRWLAIIILSLFMSFPCLAKPTPQIQQALNSTVLVYVPEVGLGSGFGVYHLNDKTLIATNDHVCQMTRGRVFLTGKVDYGSPINKLPVYVENTSGKKIKAKVVKVTNLERLKKDKKGSDLCLIEVPGKQPILDLGEDSVTGDKVFNVSAPHGLFPSIFEGYVGATNIEDEDSPNMLTISAASLPVNTGSSGSAVLDSESGKVVGVVFAIIPVSEKVVVPVASLFVPVSQLSKFLNSYVEKAPNE